MDVTTATPNAVKAITGDLEIIQHLHCDDPLTLADAELIAQVIINDVECPRKKILVAVVDKECFKVLLRAIRRVSSRVRFDSIGIVTTTDIDDECITLLTDEVVHNRDLTNFIICASPNLSENVLLGLFTALKECSNCFGTTSVINLFGPDLGGWKTFTPKVFQAYADFLMCPKQVSQYWLVGSQQSDANQMKESLFLHRALYPYLVDNKVAVSKCLLLQRSILSAIIGGDSTSMIVKAEELQYVTAQEQRRLGTVTRTLVDAYSFPYGHCFIASLHKDESADQYVSSAAVKCFHDHPATLVKALLGTAAWMEPTFRSLVSYTVTIINNADSMQGLCDSLPPVLRDHFNSVSINEKFIRISKSCSVDNSNADAVNLDHIIGDYEPCGMAQGDMIFFNRFNGLYLYRMVASLNAWTLGKVVGFASDKSFLFDHLNTYGMSTQPSILNMDPKELNQLKTYDGNTAAAVTVDFIDRVAHLSQQQLPTSTDTSELSPSGLRCEAVHGPRKQFERAAEKAQAMGDKKLVIETLKDLNRATITAENAISLAAAFHVLEALLLSVGGKVAKIKNKFDGSSADSNGPYSQPPNLHCFVKIPLNRSITVPSLSGVDPSQLEPDSAPRADSDSESTEPLFSTADVASEPFWVCEVQFTYSGILKVKAQQHSFYELERQVEDPANLSIPVFNVNL